MAIPNALDHHELRRRLANPLTAEDHQTIKDHLETLQHVRHAINRAKAAGIDVTESDSLAADAERKLRGLKQVYFPNG